MNAPPDDDEDTERRRAIKEMPERLARYADTIGAPSEYAGHHTSVPNTRRHQLQQHIRTTVKMDGETTLYTDALRSYEPKTPRGWRPSDLYVHKVIDHAEAYAIGNVHTNGMENYWSLLKRTLKGTYVSVEPFHLFRYLDEQAFRFNTRKQSDGDRFLDVAERVAGRHLTYKTLTGKTGTIDVSTP